MKTTMKTLPWALLLLSQTRAQSITSNGDYVDNEDNVTTSYYTLCPNSTSTSSAPAGSLTADPNQLTKTGDDGRTTIYRTETTILPHLCPDNDGICGATYVLSEDCPCTAQPKTAWSQCPDGFTTTAVECTVCASNGGPATVTLTIPLDNGPYASVTPRYGTPVNNPSDICTDEVPAETAPPANDDKTGYIPPSDNSWTENNAPDNYGTNDTKPYEPYTGAAGRINMGLEAYLSVIGAGLVGGLALLL